jgi:RNA polymerase sigma-70 factor, ECF subfamily
VNLRLGPEAGGPAWAPGTLPIYQGRRSRIFFPAALDDGRIGLLPSTAVSAEDAAALLARARPDLAPLTAGTPSVLGGRLGAAVAAWPSFRVPTEVWVHRLATVLPQGEDFERTPDGLALADLYLACGCLQGLPAALAIFEGQLTKLVPRAIAALDRSPVFADDVRQELLGKLLVGKPPTRPSLGRYAGRGPLLGFLAIAARRTALDLLRQRGSLELPADDAELERQLGSSKDPELEAVKARLREVFGEALRSAIRSLDPGERMTLRLTLVSRLSMEEVGHMYGVNASTICRRLARTRDHLALELRRHLSTRYEIQSLDLDSVVRLVESRLDIGLEGLLAET